MENISSISSLRPGVEVNLSLPLLESKRANIYITIAVALLATWILQSLRGGTAGKISAPLYKASTMKWIFGAEKLMRDSYDKFRDQVYQIKATEGYQVVVPPSYVGYLKTLPDDVLSAKEAINDILQSKYTNFTSGHNGRIITLLLRTKLTQNLVRLMPSLKPELDNIISSEFPACDDWTPVKWQPLAVRTVARLSGRVFVGPAISGQEAWRHTSADYAVHIFMACVKLQIFPEWARPLAQYLVWDLRTIRRDVAVARDLIRPVLEQRLRQQQWHGGGGGDDGGPEENVDEERPDDMLQWLIDALPEADKGDVEMHANQQLVLAAASIHTTTGLLYDCMFELAMDSGIQQELREEAREVLEGDRAGDENGWYQKDGMAQLRKMDSFIKEVQRVHGNITSFNRKVMKPMSLPDGTHLPVGTKIIVGQTGISRDERFFHEPNTLEPLRYYRAQHQQQDAQQSLAAAAATGSEPPAAPSAQRWQFTSVSGDDANLNFGAGRHACPGRFFAATVIKMVLARFLLGYDMRLPEGEAGPEHQALVMSKGPNQKAEILFRRRRTTAA